MQKPTEAELVEALTRANRLIEWMSKYIGAMAPGTYAECYRDINEHGIFMGRLAPVAATGQTAPHGQGPNEKQPGA